uniref:Vacuolar protein sorting-associated protein 52 homolog n=1 Tax=Panagrolaimus sp. PS1159 TaxID=55785 RepID=A0AC35GC76_9BILA
ALLNGQQAEIEGLLNRLAVALKTKKEKLVFQINNYDIILTVLDEKLQGETKERTSFWELQQTKINAYVEEVLYPHFHSLIQFVNECEPLIDQNHSQLLKRHTGKVMQLVRSFGADWKRAIEAINHEILQSFTNFKNGTAILQNAFTQFIQYYQRFNKVLSHEAFNECTVKQELINVHHIMMELKKYKPVY